MSNIVSPEVLAFTVLAGTKYDLEITCYKVMQGRNAGKIFLRHEYISKNPVYVPGVCPCNYRVKITEIEAEMFIESCK